MSSFSILSASSTPASTASESIPILFLTKFFATDVATLARILPPLEITLSHMFELGDNSFNSANNATRGSET